MAGASSTAFRGTVSDPRLGFLGDVLATPSSLPLANVFSIGDVVILIGLALLFVSVSRLPPDSAATFLRPEPKPPEHVSIKAKADVQSR